MTPEERDCSEHSPAQLDAEAEHRSTMLVAAARRKLARQERDDLAAAIDRSERRFRGAGSFESADLIRNDRADRR